MEGNCGRASRPHYQSWRRQPARGGSRLRQCRSERVGSGGGASVCKSSPAGRTRWPSSYSIVAPATVHVGLRLVGTLPLSSPCFVGARWQSTRHVVRVRHARRSPTGPSAGVQMVQEREGPTPTVWFQWEPRVTRPPPTPPVEECRLLLHVGCGGRLRRRNGSVTASSHWPVPSDTHHMSEGGQP